MISPTYYSFVCFLPSTRRAKWHINSINNLCYINFDVAMDVVLVILNIWDCSHLFFHVPFASCVHNFPQDRWCLCWIFCIIHIEALCCDRIAHFFALNSVACVSFFYILTYIFIASCDSQRAHSFWIKRIFLFSVFISLRFW